MDAKDDMNVAGSVPVEEIVDVVVVKPSSPGYPTLRAQSAILGSGNLPWTAVPLQRAPLSSSQSKPILTQAGKTKSQYLKDLMAEPETFDQIGPTWRLVLRLMVVDGGAITASYEEVARLLGDVSASTVRDWVRALEEKGIVEFKPKGRGVEIRLLGRYMDIAIAPDAVTVEIATEADPSTLALRRILDGAEELNGTVSITINGIGRNGNSGR